MARHTAALSEPVETDRPARAGGRALTAALIAVLWACGLLAGFYAMLGVGAKVGCGRSSHGLACRTAGSALGAAIVLGVIVIVTVATIAMQDATSNRSRLLRMIAGIVLLGACLLGARALLATA
jgi:hypothetical protein